MRGSYDNWKDSMSDSVFYGNFLRRLRDVEGLAVSAQTGSEKRVSLSSAVLDAAGVWPAAAFSTEAFRKGISVYWTVIDLCVSWRVYSENAFGGGSGCGIQTREWFFLPAVQRDICPGQVIMSMAEYRMTLIK